MRVEVMRKPESGSVAAKSGTAENITGENIAIGDATARAVTRENVASSDVTGRAVTAEKTSAGEQASAGFRYYGEHRQAPVRSGSLAVTDIELVRRISREPERKLLDNSSYVSTSEQPQLGLYRLYPHTGFTHQLRVAMNELGAPICADPLYPAILSREAAAARPYPLQLLAASLDFVDPVSGEPTHLESARRLALE